jgi:hypothetical protein
VGVAREEIGKGRGEARAKKILAGLEGGAGSPAKIFFTPPQGMDKRKEEQ